MSSDADLAAIRAFVATGGQFQTDKDGNIVAPIDATTDTVEIDTPAAPAAPAAPPAATPGERAADEAKAQREADRQADRATRQQRQQQQEQQRQREKNPLFRFSQGLADWAGNLPTPGGNLALVLILVFFAFAIIPVNAGKTRLQLIWLVLTGNADLQGSVPPSGQDAVGQIAAVTPGVASGIATGIGIGLGGAFPGVVPSGGGADPALFGSLGGFDPLALLEAPR